jgi:serine protease Do
VARAFCALVERRPVFNCCWPRVAAITLNVALLLIPSLRAQDRSVGGKIYKQNADSVLLLYVKSPEGSLVGQGSGFLVAGNRIVTNEHVADSGEVFVQIGPARIPAKVEKLDRFNDLAILKVEIEITASPLTLSNSLPAPGETVYAIGNPEGLEKTITQGMISSVREIDGRTLLQVSAPLSHGSSGGPLFNGAGEVVGVAVGILESGQNLNFAVPATLVGDLLRSVASSSGPTDALTTLDEVEKLNAEQKSVTYSQVQNSPYQTIESKIKDLLDRAYREAGDDPNVLLKVANLARSDDIDLSMRAAQRSNELKASAAAELTYAESAYWKSVFSEGDDKTSLLKSAEKAARSAVTSAHPPTAEIYNTLAEILEAGGSNSEADRSFRFALSAPPNIVGSDDYLQALRGLIRTSYALKNAAETQRLFDQLVSTGKASSWDWSSQGDRLSEQDKFAQAGNAYTTAAMNGQIYADWCSAAMNFDMAGQDDLVLSAARSCIEKGSGIENSEQKLSVAHRQIATILNKRGVYLEALNHAKEATALDATNAFAFDEMSVAEVGMRRFEEAVNAAQQAIRLSDGKYAFMHFNLGQAYFDLEEWDLARQSYEKAAELDPTEPASVYNLALCYGRLKYYLDSAKWYEEYLRRKPDAPDKSEILERIRILRN